MTQTLEQLSAAATQGEWMVDSVNGFIFTRPDPLTRYVIAEMQSSVTENEVFIVALVNAYRTGQLVAVQTEQPTCMLCAGKCRGHSLADSKAWEPEPGSQAFAVQDDATVERVKDAIGTSLAYDIGMDVRAGSLTDDEKRKVARKAIAAMEGPKP